MGVASEHLCSVNYTYPHHLRTRLSDSLRLATPQNHGKDRMTSGTVSLFDQDRTRDRLERVPVAELRDAVPGLAVQDAARFAVGLRVR